MHRVLRPGGKAMIVDLRKDASMQSIDAEVGGSGIGRINRAIILLTFRTMLLKRAYTARSQNRAICPADAGFGGNVTIREAGLALEIVLAK